MKITRERFIAQTGYDPEQDDLERCNCPRAGELGHLLCGWNSEQDKPRFMVGVEPTESLARDIRDWLRNWLT